MSIFGGRRDKGTTGNSGTASGGKGSFGGWTLTGTASGNDRRKVKTMRTEWTAPRAGDVAHRASRRPGKQ